jgi:sulfite dehydrogenase (quinone) subunit SoeC
MRPALSIVFFTTSSGAGFSLLALLGVSVPLGLLPTSASFAVAALAVAFLLAAGGLMSSTLHLGRPERAWRAFSQWRSSWLSREGVFSLLTFVPAAAFGVGWGFFGKTDGLISLCGIVAAALSITTIYSTGMIYASLKPVRQWHNQWVVLNYLVLGLMSGCLILDFLTRLWAERSSGVALLSLIVVLVSWWMKEQYWSRIDTTSGASTVASATTLGDRGRVRLFEAPHTENNYLLKEMGYRVARRHRTRLRHVTRLVGFAFPGLATFLTLMVGGVTGAILAGLGVASAALGLLVERWLFFAEARHTVTLYYGADAV